jgi:hypothetical protein
MPGTQWPQGLCTGGALCLEHHLSPDSGTFLTALIFRVALPPPQNSIWIVLFILSAMLRTFKSQTFLICFTFVLSLSLFAQGQSMLL